ncbi:MAG: hypothetical protein JSR41_15275 [Proteobacteria bacterium]|nr:hypothetical protein [Pseudomonadota bacterium]
MSMLLGGLIIALYPALEHALGAVPALLLAGGLFAVLAVVAARTVRRAAHRWVAQRRA